MLIKGKENTECIGEEGSSKHHLQLGDFILGYFFLMIVLDKKTILWLSSTSYFLLQSKIYRFMSQHLSTVYFLSYYLSYGILMVRDKYSHSKTSSPFFGKGTGTFSVVSSRVVSWLVWYRRCIWAQKVRRSECMMVSYIQSHHWVIGSPDSRVGVFLCMVGLFC